MTHKFAGFQDYVVGKLEAQWWQDDPNANFSTVPPERWNWRLMIRTPSFVTLEEVKEAASKLIENGKAPNADEVKLESIPEGKCVQMLHVGPYDQECVTIDAMRAFVEENGWVLHGRHHEIYLSDPRRVAPEKIRTILRHPVKKASS